jgi:WD40 repeat protein
LWDLVEGKPIGKPLLEEVHTNEMRFIADGRVLATTAGKWGERRRCWQHDAEDGRPLGPVQEAGDFISIIDVNPDSRSFLTRTTDGWGSPSPPRLWDSLTGKPRGVSVAIRTSAAAFHPSGRFVALDGYDEHARLWSLDVGKPIGPPLPHPRSEGVAFHPSGRLLATWASPDRTARLWKVADPVTGSPAEVKRRVEALTGQELDEAGVAQELNRDELEKRRQQVEGLAPWSP